jgi:hypothetical protein
LDLNKLKNRTILNFNKFEIDFFFFLKTEHKNLNLNKKENRKETEENKSPYPGWPSGRRIWAERNPYRDERNPLMHANEQQIFGLIFHVAQFCCTSDVYKAATLIR